jgi:hypothetical protein
MWSEDEVSEINVEVKKRSETELQRDGKRTVKIRILEWRGYCRQNCRERITSIKIHVDRR